MIKRQTIGKRENWNVVLKKTGFSLIEVLVAVVLVMIGVVALVGALAAYTRTETAILSRDLQSKLAHEKLDEMVATEGYLTAAGGSFDDTRYKDYSWTVSETPVGIEGLTLVSVTVTSSKLGEVKAETITFDTTAVVETEATQ